MDEQAIINEAFKAARDAEAEFRAKHGEPFYCGFAWVTIRPGNCKVARILKQQGLARKGYYGGMEVWNPGGSMTQSMDIKECGAHAFAEVLRKYNIKASAGSRAD